MSELAAIELEHRLANAEKQNAKLEAERDAALALLRECVYALKTNEVDETLRLKIEAHLGAK